MNRPVTSNRTRLPDSSPIQRRLVARGESSVRNNFTPAFWSRLSRAWLTPRALREHDRRNRTLPLPQRPSSPSDGFVPDLARFARAGGPDLSYLRGCPHPRALRPKISIGSPAVALRPQQETPQPTQAVRVAVEARDPSAYDANFETHLIDNGIYPAGYQYPDNRSNPEPNECDAIRQDLALSRPFSSLTRLSKSFFKEFKQKNKVPCDIRIMSDVIPFITGDSDIPYECNLPFTNIASLTRDTPVKAVPDCFDGVSLRDVHERVRQELGPMIVPIQHAVVPVVPNFFIEAKSDSKLFDVARRQACYDGAHGARAMHALQNYKKAVPTYDGKAHTYSAVYVEGTLTLYAHYVAEPATAGGQPKYYMTQLNEYEMTSNREAFVKGATAFRNARDMAKRHRESFIQAANQRASQVEVHISRGINGDRTQIGHNSGPNMSSHRTQEPAVAGAVLRDFREFANGELNRTHHGLNNAPARVESSIANNPRHMTGRSGNPISSIQNGRVSKNQERRRIKAQRPFVPITQGMESR